MTNIVPDWWLEEILAETRRRNRAAIAVVCVMAILAVLMAVGFWLGGNP